MSVNERFERRRRRKRAQQLRTRAVAVGALLVLVVGATYSLGIWPGKRSGGPLQSRYQVSAWTFGSLSSLTHAADARAINEVDLDHWHLHADGRVYPGSFDPSFVEKVHGYHLAVYATVTNMLDDSSGFDQAIAHAILATPRSRLANVERLVALCQTSGYDGIDLDWESLAGSDRARFSAYVNLLARKLHAAGKRLSVAVYAKTSEYPWGREDAPAAEDYAALGRAADALEIMTYDQHGSGTGPGPISSRRWMTQVLDYAESRVAPDKIRLGIPFYGYDWANGSASGLVWSSARSLISEHHSAVHRSGEGEPYFSYLDSSNRRHTVYFQDSASIAAKIDYVLQRKPAIAGIAIWVMGGEDPNFWQDIHDKLTQGLPH